LGGFRFLAASFSAVQRRREQQQMVKLMQGEGSAIIDRRPGEDMTPEEHQRRGDAADALFREIVRRVAAAQKPGEHV
jgi:hypothetical protein